MAEPSRARYPLHMPQSLKRAITRLAREDGVSVNQWIVSAIAQKVGAVETAAAMLAARAGRAEPGALQRLLDRAPDTEPALEDRLDPPATERAGG